MNLTLAWKRTKLDISRKRIIGKCAYELEIVDKNVEWYLNNLEKELRERFVPSTLTICEMPKAKGLVRPGGRLTLKDRIVYNALVGEFYPQILKKLNWSQEKIDFGNVPTGKPGQVEWIKNQFEPWNSFRENSLKRISQGYNYVVSTDISAYYENIGHLQLLSDLRLLGADEKLLQLLGKCLKKWYPIGRGIPQGFIASDILSKVYLDSIDENLLKAGYKHLRYSDDIRIFCKNLTEARKSLLILARLLRARGLNLQTAKTDILPASKAKTIFQGEITIIGSVRQRILDSYLTNPYLTDREIELLSRKYAPSSKSIVRETYKANFLDPQKYNSFDKSLFHFLLNGLSALKDDFAEDHCLTLIRDRPEETTAILKYFKNIGTNVDVYLVDFLNSEDAIYTYQNFQIMEWFSERSQLPDNIVRLARKFCFDENQPIYLRSVSRKIIGNLGTAADLEQIEESYSNSSSQLEQCEIICALQKMEKSKRNAFFSRVKDDGPLHKIAVEFAKS